MSDLNRRESRVFFPTYGRLPLEIERGEGVHLYTRDGRKMLDMFGGLAVNALGYGHPAILEAVERQIHRYFHLSNSFVSDVQVEFVERLLAASGFDRCFLGNSGTEAMEAALKLVRRWGTRQHRSTIIGLSGSFHGRTLGALSITGREKYREGFEPLLPGTMIIPFNDPEALATNVDEHTLAVVVEPIQGEGGIRPLSQHYVDRLAALRERFGFLIIADEIQSGAGRTGKFLASEHYGLRPDIAVLAKAIGGGLPLGAMLAGDSLAGLFQKGAHGSTFGGNPVACAAGIAVLREIVDGGVMSHVASVGAYLRESLEALAGAHPDLISEVRGIGLMQGVELTGNGDPVQSALLDRGVIVSVTNGNVLRFLPPLVIKTSHVAEAVEALGAVLGGIGPEQR
jgi:acetylornithine/N-succinyldiaminopimelate aminotransferase